MSVHHEEQTKYAVDASLRRRLSASKGIHEDIGWKLGEKQSSCSFLSMISLFSVDGSDGPSPFGASPPVSRGHRRNPCASEARPSSLHSRTVSTHHAGFGKV